MQKITQVDLATSLLVEEDNAVGWVTTTVSTEPADGGSNNTFAGTDSSTSVQAQSQVKLVPQFPLFTLKCYQSTDIFAIIPGSCHCSASSKPNWPICLWSVGRVGNKPKWNFNWSAGLEPLFSVQPLWRNKGIHSWIAHRDHPLRWILGTPILIRCQ